MATDGAPTAHNGGDPVATDKRHRNGAGGVGDLVFVVIPVTILLLKFVPVLGVAVLAFVVINASAMTRQIVRCAYELFAVCMLVDGFVFLWNKSNPDYKLPALFILRD